MHKTFAAIVLFLLAIPFSVSAEDRVVCTIFREIGSSSNLVEEGQCDERYSSASTFKLAISLMGFDSGILNSSDSPEWPFQEDYYDWRPEWRKRTTPQSWLEHSVVWYSQQITQRLGAETFANYVQKFDYGNEDVTGEEGYDGLTHAWLSMSLRISANEQIDFLTKMLEQKLPVSTFAVVQTKTILKPQAQPEGWVVYGKTGAGFPHGTDGKRQMDQRFGWYVGWAEKGSRTIVFAQLMRFDKPPEQPPGSVARNALMEVLFAGGGPLFQSQMGE
ncbi:class D beta-lactamase [uncultured Roseobacter sp.]|uniref:class D beta-lactamase n=1 Tax=uncultured Roseobacter sp. TaxID=114847 RepID=UPI0026241FDD|nr:class D beta-lactamase [uncultured Roseobacter sp.]